MAKYAAARLGSRPPSPTSGSLGAASPTRRAPRSSASRVPNRRRPGATSSADSLRRSRGPSRSAPSASARSHANSTARARNSGGCGAGIRTPLREAAASHDGIRRTGATSGRRSMPDCFFKRQIRREASRNLIVDETGRANGDTEHPSTDPHGHDQDTRKDVPGLPPRAQPEARSHPSAPDQRHARRPAQDLHDYLVDRLTPDAGGALRRGATGPAPN